MSARIVRRESECRAAASCGKSQTGLIVGMVLLGVTVICCPFLIIVCLAAISVLGQKASGTFTAVVRPSLPAASSAPIREKPGDASGGWSKATLPGDHTLQVSDAARGLYLVVTTEKKADFADNMKIGEYAKLVTQNSLAALDDSKILSGPTETVVDGRPAIQHEITGTLKDNRIKVGFITVAVDGKKHFYYVVAWTVQSGYARSRPELEQFCARFARSNSGKPAAIAHSSVNKRFFCFGERRSRAISRCPAPGRVPQRRWRARLSWSGVCAAES